jgi:MFS family permease
MSIDKHNIENQLWSERFILLCSINFLLFMGFFLLLPTLPVYLVNVLGAREDQVGLIIGAFTIAAVIARPFTGYWMDHGNQKKLYFIAIFIFLVATAGYMFAQTILMLLILRFIHGFGFGMSTTAGGTMAAEWIPAERRGEGIGYFGTFIMVAMVIGPMIGLVIAEQLSYTLMFIICSVLAGFAVVLSLFLTSPKKDKSSLAKGVDRKFSLKNREEIRYLFSTLFEVKAIPISLSMMMIAVVFGGVVSFIALYAIELGDAKMAGVYFALYAIALIVTRPFAGRWFDEKGPFAIVASGSFLYFIGVILLGLANGPILLYVAAIVIGAGYGSLQPSYQALIIQEAADNRRGAATATFFTSFDIGVGFGAFILGALIPWIGYSLMFLLSSIFLIFSFLIFYRYWSKKQSDSIQTQEESIKM